MNLNPDVFIVDSERPVLTNGCFDVLHIGHIRLLRRAKMFGNRLVVAINTDESVRALKGPSRPIVPLAQRMEMLEAISCVDLVICFSEIDAAKVIRDYAPHCWIKGGDYTMETLNKDEVAAAKEVGAAIVILPRFGDYSTTGILERMKA